MTIELENIGKRFNNEWIFRNVELRLETGSRTGIVGPNGSGKSTLLQCISGFLTSSEGTLRYQARNSDPIEIEKVHRQTSIAAPYLYQDEWLTFREAVEIQTQFKPLKENVTVDDVIDKSGLNASQNKYLRQFSSGMKQRVRLILAILADTELLLLDEPLSNLDEAGAQWFKQLMEQECTGRTVVICSNHHATELASTNHLLDIAQFKPNG